MNTEQSTDGAGTECVRSEYGAKYGRERVRSAYGVNTEHSTDGVGTEHIWSGYGADQRWSWGSGGE